MAFAKCLQCGKEEPMGELHTIERKGGDYEIVASYPKSEAWCFIGPKEFCSEACAEAFILDGDYPIPKPINNP
jgi:hypothetical protein